MNKYDDLDFGFDIDDMIDNFFKRDTDLDKNYVTEYIKEKFSEEEARWITEVRPDGKVKKYKEGGK